MTEHDISSEKWREYDFDGRIYRIENPVTLVLREGGTTHRVIDKNGIVHCCPAVGNNRCVLRWEAHENAKKVVL